MNLIRFIKQVQSLDKEALQALFEALLSKKRVVKYGTPEYANLDAQANIVCKLLIMK